MSMQALGVTHLKRRYGAATRPGRICRGNRFKPALRYPRVMAVPETLSRPAGRATVAPRRLR